MAFCNSCGSALEGGAKFCPKCGTPAPAGAASASVAAPAPVAAAPATTTQGSSALKIILIVLAVIIGLGVLGAGTVAFFIHRAISRTHVVNRDGEVKVETPFGTVESSENASEAAKNVGVDLYPGATMSKGSAANLTIGGMHTAAVELETSDPPSAVNDYYRAKFPRSSMTSNEGDHYSIVAGDKNDMITINIEPRDGKTRIQISKLTKMGN